MVTDVSNRVVTSRNMKCDTGKASGRCMGRSGVVYDPTVVTRTPEMGAKTTSRGPDPVSPDRFVCFQEGINRDPRQYHRILSARQLECW